MNAQFKFLALSLAAGTAGLAGFGLSNTEFAARLPLDTIFAATATLGLIHITFADYSRRVKPPSPRATILHPGKCRAAQVSACVKSVAA